MKSQAWRSWVAAAPRELRGEPDPEHPSQRGPVCPSCGAELGTPDSGDYTETIIERDAYPVAYKDGEVAEWEHVEKEVERYIPPQWICDECGEEGITVDDF